MTFVAAVVIGLVVGRIREPMPEPTPPAWLGLLFAAAAGQLLLSRVPEPLRADLVGPALFAVNGGVGAFLLVNSARPQRWRPAFVVAAVGWLLNAAVVAANGSMPVSISAVERAGFDSTTDVADGFLYEHEPESAATSLAMLGDVIPVPAGPLRQVISVGDVLLAAGIALAATELARPRLDLETRAVGGEVT